MAGNVPASPTPKIQYWEDFFVYDATFAALASLTSSQQNIQIQADSSFKWTAAAFYADIAAAAFTASAQPIPNVTIQILDTGSGRQLFQDPIPVPSVFGSGQLPFILPVPRIFKARSAIQLTAANFDAAVDYNLRLMLIGTKIFQGSRPV